jgi:ankyrin repeat protein
MNKTKEQRKLDGKLIEACYNNHPEIVKKLLKNGANVKVIDEDDNSPLHIACSYGHTKVVKLLLKNGADVNIVDKYGDTPLHLACYRGHTEIRKLLEEHIERGACKENKERA